MPQKKKWKWEISPHPYSGEWDCMVTNSDEEALKAILHVAEMHLWDGNDGGERTVKVVRNPDHRRRLHAAGGTRVAVIEPLEIEP